MELAVFVTKRPVLSFFLLTFIISWGIWIPALILYMLNPFPLVSLASVPLPLLILYTLGFFGPTFAALIITGLQEGPSGITKLLSRWKIWRIGMQWYLATLLIEIVVVLVAIQLYILLFTLSPQVTWGLWYLFFPVFLQFALIGGPIAEETGWRGYALPRMMKSQNALNASLLLGLLWAIWHLPVKFVDIPVPLDPFIFGIFSLNTITLSVIMAWLFNNTRGSVFICYLYHIMVNTVGTVLLGAIFHFENVGLTWMMTVTFITALHCVLAIALVLFYGPTLSHNKIEDTSNPSQIS
ncbi:MAG: type II CAAX prenyl endopeptidase Rce1 family protein [Candidatus Hermodarchaeota archaeon]